MKKSALAFSFLLLGGAAFLPVTVGAQDVWPPAPVSEEFVRVFSDYCLQKFPNGLDEQVAKDMLEPMTAAQVRTVLGKDTGLGWVVKGREIQYVLTVEQPPLQTCSLRRVSDKAMNGDPLITAVRKFVEDGGHKLMAPVGHDRPLGRGTIRRSQVLQELDEKDKPLPQAYMFFVDSYPPVVLPNGTLSKPFYEIRFVRQMYRQQT